jgi:hypothetical protein
MLYDCRGIAVTTDDRKAALHMEAAVRSFLAHRRDSAMHLGHALAADPELSLAHLLVGFGHMLLGRSELIGLAQISTSRARAAIEKHGATRREEQLIQALDAWIAGDMVRCAALLVASLRDQPLDALTFKLSHAVMFMLGDTQGMRAAADMVLPAWTDTVPGFGFILGCHAFALVEAGELSTAESSGRQAIEIQPDDVWGCHALLHVHYVRRRANTGLALLNAWEKRLGPVNNFAYHLNWHGALFHIAEGRLSAAIELYDWKIRDTSTDDYRDIANAASLLWRLEQEGCDVGPRWQELASLADGRIDDGALTFAQMHYLLCLIGAGRRAGVRKMLAAMHSRAGQDRRSQTAILDRVGIALATTISRRFLDTTKRNLWTASALKWTLRQIGGSTVQREIFVRMVEEAAAECVQPGETGIDDGASQSTPIAAGLDAAWVDPVIA